MKILIIEDEERLARNLKHVLADDGYNVEYITTYHEIIERILLDLMLAAEDG